MLRSTIMRLFDFKLGSVVSIQGYKYKILKHASTNRGDFVLCQNIYSNKCYYLDGSNTAE